MKVRYAFIVPVAVGHHLRETIAEAPERARNSGNLVYKLWRPDYRFYRLFMPAGAGAVFHVWGWP
jgi:hypothetical protein